MSTCTRRFCGAWILACVLIAGGSNATAQNGEIHDEYLRTAVLSAIFPGMRISEVRGKRIDDSWPKKVRRGELFFPDALLDETVYRVVGRPQNQVEREASEDVASRSKSNSREVRFKLFRYSSDQPDDIISVLQYRFPSAFPALAVQSIGLLVYVTHDHGGWRIQDERLLKTHRHTALQGAQMIDLNADGKPELVIESDLGGPGVQDSQLQVFDLSAARFNRIQVRDSRLLSYDQDKYTDVLDVESTLASHGQKYCSVTTTFIENGRTFHPPRIREGCDKWERGRDYGEKMDSKAMLKRLRR